MTEMSWPAYLRAAMEAREIRSASALADRAGLDRSVVSQWLRGKAEPSLASLDKLKGVLDRPLLELMVFAGLISLEDAQMKERPAPPEPVYVDLVILQIRSAGFPPKVEQALIRIRQSQHAQMQAMIDAVRAARTP